MKKTNFILLFIFISIFSFASKPRVVLNPSFEVKTTGISNVSKIELGKESTRLYIDITFTPHWWINYSNTETIKDAETGKTYTVTGIEGGKFDEKIWIPDSGDTTVVLVFPPLEKSVKKIDYNNQIFGISLEKKKGPKKETASIPAEVNEWLDKELSKVPRDKPMDFESPLFFNSDTARLIGYLKGYDTRLGFSTGLIYASNQLTREDYPITVQIFPDGRFEAECPLVYPMFSYISMNNQGIKFYLEPGQTLGMILNWEEFLNADRNRNVRLYQFKDIEYRGPLAKINSELNGYSFDLFDYEGFQKKLETLSPEEFKKERIALSDQNKRKVEDYIQHKAITPQAALLLKNNLLLENASILFDFIRNRSYKAPQDTANKILQLPIPADYYDFLKRMPLNDRSLLVNMEFSSFINRFEFCTPFNVSQGNPILLPEKDFFTYLKEKNVALAAEDIALIKTMEKIKKTKDEGAFYEKEELKVQDLFEKYKDFQPEYSEKYIAPLQKKTFHSNILQSWRLKDSVLINTLGLKPNLMYEISKVRSLQFMFTQLDRSAANELWGELKPGITDPFLLATGEAMLNKMLPEKEFSAYSLSPSVGTDIFKKIIDPFKGKILFVDFWATTCGPCVGNIKHMKPTRERYKDNPDFEFIFITEKRASPQQDYTKFVEEQALKNTFYVSTDDFNHLRELFKFNGIPRYVAMDIEGKVLNPDFPMDNFETELVKIMKNK